jgi:hypothetical protein
MLLADASVAGSDVTVRSYEDFREGESLWSSPRLVRRDCSPGMTKAEVKTSSERVIEGRRARNSALRDVRANGRECLGERSVERRATRSVKRVHLTRAVSRE